MADTTKIEWADKTFNPWIGCTKVSPACDHCYAERDFDHRRHVVQWGAGQPRKRTSEANWKEPLRWNKEAEKLKVRYRVFCASLADVFDNEVPIEWRRDLFDLIELTPRLDWLLLTKRIGNVFEMVSRARTHDWLQGRKNVWLGISICNQAEADRDIPKLLNMPANIKFLSIEPQLGPIELSAGLVKCPNANNSIMDPTTGIYECCRQCDYTGLTGEFGINWVIVGGESGPQARPIHPDWVRSLRDQCDLLGVPFLFKQWGEFKPVGRKELNIFDTPSQGYIHPTMKYGELPYTPNGGIPSDDELEAAGCAYVARVGKKAAGRLLDGVEYTEFPT